VARQNDFSDKDGDRRSGKDRRSRYPQDRSAEEKFLLGKQGRFTRHKNLHKELAQDDDAMVDRRRATVDRRSSDERRTGADRRCGYDKRSEVERFLQGERRSGLDRRSRIKGGYRTFKQARTFVRGLGLKSERTWLAYAKSAKKPADIPAAPQDIYADEGWAGWSDWLDARTTSVYLSQYRPFEKARAFVRGLGLVSTSKWKAYCKRPDKPADIPTDPQTAYAGAGWAGWDDWLGSTARPGP
jgi:hypothetical protein